jgi:hypothetical protein
MIHKKVCKKVDFWRMFRLFSKTGGVVVVDEGNIRNRRKIVQSPEYKVQSKRNTETCPTNPCGWRTGESRKMCGVKGKAHLPAICGSIILAQKF